MKKIITMILFLSMNHAMALEYGGKVICGDSKAKSLTLSCLDTDCSLISLERTGYYGLDSRKTGTLIDAGDEIENIKLKIGGYNVAAFNDATTGVGKVALGLFGYPVAVSRNLSDAKKSRKATATVKQALHFLFNNSNKGKELRINCDNVFDEIADYASSYVEGVDTDDNAGPHACVQGKRNGICTTDKVMTYNHVNESEYKVLEILSRDRVLLKALSEEVNPGVYVAMDISELYVSRNMCHDHVCKGEQVNIEYEAEQKTIHAFNIYTGKFVTSQEDGVVTQYDVVEKSNVFKLNGCIADYCINDDVIINEKLSGRNYTEKHIGEIIGINVNSKRVMIYDETGYEKKKAFSTSEIERKI